MDAEDTRGGSAWFNVFPLSDPYRTHNVMEPMTRGTRPHPVSRTSCTGRYSTVSLRNTRRVAAERGLPHNTELQYLGRVDARWPFLRQRKHRTSRSRRLALVCCCGGSRVVDRFLGSNQSPPPSNEEAWSLKQLQCMRTWRIRLRPASSMAS